MKEDDIIGILESDDGKDMKPLNDRVLIKVFIFVIKQYCIQTTLC
jgi:hypothetical protein